jgi:hypothetical protein
MGDPIFSESPLDNVHRSWLAQKFGKILRSVFSVQGKAFFHSGLLQRQCWAKSEKQGWVQMDKGCAFELPKRGGTDFRETPFSGPFGALSSNYLL